MKKFLFTVALLTGITAATRGQQAVHTVENQPYIEVIGYHKQEVAPDEIYISFQIQESDTKGRVSLSDQEKQMAAALRSLGFDIEAQLSVTDMSSHFKKYVLRRTDIQMSREYQLKVADAQTAASVFAALESVGIANGTISKAEYSKIDEL
ncbi:MAG: SIMPL domain-containing protein, partial [Rikenellaceae bacterium]|nr:SIMPL domain-containing protein [Rikenellaceae bacterium]